MRVLGLVFAGTSTTERAAMASFCEDVLELERVHVEGVEADLFALADGATFAVASPASMGDSRRSIGFLVEDLVGAAIELADLGVDVGSIAENERARYLHVRAPDHQLYELIEQKPCSPTSV